MGESLLSCGAVEGYGKAECAEIPSREASKQKFRTWSGERRVCEDERRINTLEGSVIAEIQDVDDCIKLSTIYVLCIQNYIRYTIIRDTRLYQLHNYNHIRYKGKAVCNGAVDTKSICKN